MPQNVGEFRPGVGLSGADHHLFSAFGGIGVSGGTGLEKVSQLVYDAGAEIFNQNVGLPEHPLQDLPALGMLQIEGNAPLPAVEDNKIVADTVLFGQLVPGQVPRPRGLDFDDIRSHVGQHGSRQRACD